MFVYRRRCSTLPRTASRSDFKFNSGSKGVSMNEPQDNILEDESSLNFSQRSRGENEKIIGKCKTRTWRKAFFNYVTTTNSLKFWRQRKRKLILPSIHIGTTLTHLCISTVYLYSIGTRVLLALLIKQEHSNATAWNKIFFLFKRWKCTTNKSPWPLWPPQGHKTLWALWAQT